MVHDAINNFVHRKQRKILYFTLSRRNVEVKKKKKTLNAMIFVVFIEILDKDLLLLCYLNLYNIGQLKRGDCAVQLPQTTYDVEPTYLRSGSYNPLSWAS